MRIQLILQIALLVLVAALGRTMLRFPGGTRHQAGRRLLTMAFIVLAAAFIAVPGLASHAARLLGVDRSSDLLLYGLIVAFLTRILTDFRRDVARERQITQLARRIALDDAPDPRTAGAADVVGAAGAADPGGTAAGGDANTPPAPDGEPSPTPSEGPAGATPDEGWKDAEN